MHIQGVWKISIQENLVDAARRRKNNCIIDALIKMMLIDDHIDPREHAKISEIYYHLFGEKPEPDYIEKRSFEILREEDLEQISEVGKVVAESLKDKNPKSNSCIVRNILCFFELTKSITRNQTLQEERYNFGHLTRSFF